MQRFDLRQMVRGWFVGNFSPAALHCEHVEVAVKHYRAGDREPCHYHRVASEVTLILKGRVRMCGQEFSDNDIVVLQPLEATDFEALEDTITVVVKTPAAPNDKYLGSPQ